MLNLRSINIIGRTYRHVNRYRQILTILFKYGFDNIIDVLKIDQYLEVGLQMISRKKREKVERLTPQERVRLIFEELGPTFIKFGQILSTRPDLIPLPFLHELEKLQDNVPPFSFAEVKSIISSEFKSNAALLNHLQNQYNLLEYKSNHPNKNIAEPFESIEELPLASASIGQVHRAVLKTGEKVAVKIQRPGIKRLIEVDLEILLHLATLMERHIEDLSFFRPVKIVQEFAATLERELDYTLEASNMIRVERQFPSDKRTTNIVHGSADKTTKDEDNDELNSDNKAHCSKHNHGIYIPKVYLEHTTCSILTMEYVEGIKISEVETLDAKGYDRKLLTKRGADFILTQVLDYGFFHGDLHPGNIFVLPDNIICPIDFGIMGFVDQYSREVFVDIIANTVMQNTSQISRLLLELTDYDEEPDLRALERDIAGFTGQYLAGSALKHINMGKMLQDIVQIALNHRLRLMPETFLMLKAFTAVEGVAQMVDPEFDMVSHAAPYIKKAKMARFSPSRISDDMSRVSSESIKLLQSIPRESLAIIRQLRKGKLTIGFDVQRLERILAAQHQSNNRIAIAIIIASLILASSLLLCFAVPPLILGLSLPGIIGLGCAGFIGFMLIISIFKQ
ncbi:MAG: AarF/ABC1/UbiB kinase family protein [Desulfamplus sp.]|nr:AarF/ABC1/UbiB kinase family protein [Desulfamplus sp.]